MGFNGILWGFNWIYLFKGDLIECTCLNNKKSLNLPSGNQTWQWKIPQVKVFMGKSSVDGGFSIATFDYRMVIAI